MTNIVPVELAQLTAQIDQTNAQRLEIIASTARNETKLTDEILTSTKQRLAIDSDIALKTDELQINTKKKFIFLIFCYYSC